MVRPRKIPSSEFLACLFCDFVAPTRGNLNVHLDKTLPAYRLAFGHTKSPPDRLHHLGIIRAHRMPVGRAGIDVQEPDAVLRLVLAEFARYTEYTTAEKKLPPRTRLCEVDVLWWQAAVDEVVDAFTQDEDRAILRRNVMALVSTAKRLLREDVGTRNNVAVNIEPGFVGGDLLMKGDVVTVGRKVDRSVHDNRGSAFAESSTTAASRKRKGKQPAMSNENDYDDDDVAFLHQDEDTRFDSAVNDTVDQVDLTHTDSSSSDSDAEPATRIRRARLPSPDPLSLPAPRRVVSPSVVIPKPPTPHHDLDPLFTLQVSILRRPAITVPVYGHETLAGIIRAAWKHAPKAVRANTDAKVMSSEEPGWGGIWTDRLWWCGLREPRCSRLCFLWCWCSRSSGVVGRVVSCFAGSLALLVGGWE